ncbi:hypothetical protein EKQ37_002053 [Neisseria gonorrhoeae]
MTGFEIAVLSGMTGFEIAVLSGMTGFEIAVLSDGFQDCGVVGNDGSGILLRPPRACKRRAIKNAV